MQELVSLGKVLSDINRVKILALLHREKKLCVCELCDTLELSQPLVSRHLKMMRAINLVSSKQEGKWITYFLQEHTLLYVILESISKETEELPSLIKCAKI